MNKASVYKAEASKVAQKQLRLQENVASKDKRKKAAPEKAMQAGARKYPEPPVGHRHLAKPGEEAHMDMPPY